MKGNVAKAKAIERKNKEQLLKLNPKLNDNSGIYFMTRKDENGFRFAYIGQARRILTRLSGHLCGYQQHIDLSLRKHKLWSENNPYGWKISALNFPIRELDEKEKYFIKKYADAGYQLRNVSVGGQGENRDGGQIGERKPSKGYRDGLIQGRKSLAKELKEIIDKHLEISLKPEKEHNKISIKQFERFRELLNMESNDGKL